ncbi:dihydrodipicolinate synthetase [Methylobacterium sp. 4-46]|uniref:dihydrodipicolinate synthase family protein n=1 Tax=unclassified Methylobacterium TaxID=2615210 RepID=UPI000152D341|nr:MULTISPECIES: dihydrodipicolinate synthase family protein [Methylobacterium]ACA19905.1 dihydrodipicolinate synthetase [Methylobacterium sp. 4-46]WFT79092.1 dihydrodipicolinate synthase family protein [Methylobacterium nodulans]
MPVVHDLPTDRTTLTGLLFPAGVPMLWSPTLVFYDEAGRIDRDRQLAHLAFMTPHVKGYLVPGSTGDAWEMNDAEALAALEVVLPFAAQHGLDLLVGVLRPTTDAMLALIDKVLDYLCRRAGTDSVADALAASHVRGLTVAPPTSDPPLSQDAIGAALAPVFERGLPIALYQLPQVTGNTMTPALVAGLAERFPNLLLFKDSSGTDEVALSGRMPAGVTLLRGAEGDYAQWSKAHGGVYDGFLLSTANAFPAQLATVLEHLQQGRFTEAEQCSASISAAVADAFRAVIEVRQGNAFTNANKAIAHIMAYGRDALQASPPRLYAGGHLPHSVLRTVMESLSRHGLLPVRGYLES